MAGQKTINLVNGIDIHGDKIRQEITARLSEKIDSLPQSRKEKVIAVRHQLEAGEYGINEHLNVATDRLIEKLIKKEDGRK